MNPKVEDLRGMITPLTIQEKDVWMLDIYEDDKEKVQFNIMERDFNGDYTAVIIVTIFSDANQKGQVFFPVGSYQ